MSHFTTIETQIRDLEALRDACAELGVRLLDKTEARGFGSNRLVADHVIRLKGPYDIAVTRVKTNGNYHLATDWWDGHVQKEVGPKFGTLLQLYAANKVIREARKHGRRVRRRKERDGTIRLTIQEGARS